MNNLKDLIIENETFVDELSDHQVQVTKDVIKIADKYGVDRNELFYNYCRILMVSSAISDLINFDLGGSNANTTH